MADVRFVYTVSQPPSRSSTGASARSIRVSAPARELGEPAAGGQAEEVDEVGAVARARGQVVGRRRRGAGGDDDVGERGRVVAEEAGDAHSQPAAHVEGQRPHQPPVLVGDVDAQRAAGPELPPPGEQPAVEQERARARHRAHERVPLRRKPGEAVLVRDRGEAYGHAARAR